MMRINNIYFTTYLLHYSSYIKNKRYHLQLLFKILGKIVAKG